MLERSSSGSMPRTLRDAKNLACSQNALPKAVLLADAADATTSTTAAATALNTEFGSPGVVNVIEVVLGEGLAVGYIREASDGNAALR